MESLEEDVSKFNKGDLIGITMNLPAKMESFNREVLKDIKDFNEKSVRLEFDLVITKNAKKVLPLQLIETEKKCWTDSQQSRRETLEVVAPLKSLSNDEV